MDTPDSDGGVDFPGGLQNTEGLPPAPDDPRETKEGKSLSLLLTLMGIYAPHMSASFVCSRLWWRKHEGKPEAHVSPLALKPHSGVFMPSFPQMFKYLLLGALEDVLVIFNTGRTEEVPRIKRLLREANSEAAPVWRNEEIPFATRRKRCHEILRPVLRLNGREAGDFRPVPPSVVDELSTIFRRFYGQGQPGALLLIGRTEERAYEVQDEYGRSVSQLLGTLDEKYESRAITRLRKVYGRGSLPLLCLASASALWQLCSHPFYKRQISLVSLPCLPRWIPR